MCEDSTDDLVFLYTKKEYSITLLVLLLLGPIVGIIASFFGIGGGIILVPSLYALFPNANPVYIIATSLALIFTNALFNYARYFKKINLSQLEKEQLNSFYIINFFVFLGVAISTLVVDVFSKTLLQRLFGSMVLLIIINSFITDLLKSRAKSKSKKNETNTTNATDQKSTRPSYSIDTGSQKRSTLSKLLSYTFVLFGSFLSGLTGVGGGIIVIPIYLFFLKIPVKMISTLTNSSIIVATSISVLVYLFKNVKAEPINTFNINHFDLFQIGAVNWGIVFIIMIGATIATPIGLILNQKLSNRTIKILFYILLTILALKIF